MAYRKLLAIETSAEACSVALAVGGQVDERFELAPMRHAELLLPFVQELLSRAEQPLGGLDAIAFGRGPGSFTSLRIGIGVVQGLAWGADIPVVPVSSLASAAQDAAERAEGGAGRVRVALDARMAEVWTADFELDESGLARPLGAERVCAPGAVSEPPNVPFIAAGNAFARFESLQALGRHAVHCDPDAWPRAATVVRLARDWLLHNEPLPAAQAQPTYIRNDVAEKPTAG